MSDILAVENIRVMRAGASSHLMMECEVRPKFRELCASHEALRSKLVTLEAELAEAKAKYDRLFRGWTAVLRWADGGKLDESQSRSFYRATAAALSDASTARPSPSPNPEAEKASDA